MHATQYESDVPRRLRHGDHPHRGLPRRTPPRRLGGLGFKTYLMRERGVRGSPVNQYAPFYLWNTVEGMNSFLWDGAFQGLVDDFGRPVVQNWTGLAYEEGGAADASAQVAVRRRQPVPEGVDLAEVMADAAAETERLASLDGAVCAAVDPRHWSWSTSPSGTTTRPRLPARSSRCCTCRPPARPAAPWPGGGGGLQAPKAPSPRGPARSRETCRRSTSGCATPTADDLFFGSPALPGPAAALP